jgi:hypothetical protein
LAEAVVRTRSQHAHAESQQRLIAGCLALRGRHRKHRGAAAAEGFADARGPRPVYRWAGVGRLLYLRQLQEVGTAAAGAAAERLELLHQLRQIIEGNGTAAG